MNVLPMYYRVLQTESPLKNIYCRQIGRCTLTGYLDRGTLTEIVVHLGVSPVRMTLFGGELLIGAIHGHHNLQKGVIDTLMYLTAHEHF